MLQLNASVDDTTPLAIERRTVYVFTLMGGGGTILSSCLHISPGCTEVFLFSWFTFITDIHTNYFFGYSILYAFSRHNRSISINTQVNAAYHLVWSLTRHDTHGKRRRGNSRLGTPNNTFKNSYVKTNKAFTCKKILHKHKNLLSAFTNIPETDVKMSCYKKLMKLFTQAIFAKIIIVFPTYTSLWLH